MSGASGALLGVRGGDRKTKRQDADVRRTHQAGATVLAVIKRAPVRASSLVDPDYMGIKQPAARSRFKVRPI
jgi:hypothetical protein